MPQQERNRRDSLAYLARSIRNITNSGDQDVSNGVLKALIDCRFSGSELLGALRSNGVTDGPRRLVTFFARCEKKVADLPATHGRRTGLEAARLAANVPTTTQAQSKRPDKQARRELARAAQSASASR